MDLVYFLVNTNCDDDTDNSDDEHANYLVERYFQALTSKVPDNVTRPEFDAALEVVVWYDGLFTA